jgi:hypothetical protein
MKVGKYNVGANLKLSDINGESPPDAGKRPGNHAEERLTCFVRQLPSKLHHLKFSIILSPTENMNSFPPRFFHAVGAFTLLPVLYLHSYLLFILV